MTASWTYFNPVRVTSSPGAIARIGELVAYQRMLLVTSPGFSKRGVVERIGHALGARLAGIVDDVSPNPDVIDIDRQAAALRHLQPDAIIGLGGGSSMDTAKALARLLVQPTGTKLAIHFRDGVALAPLAALPVVAIPTTAGTGAEVTPFGTVWDFEHAKKYSVAGDDLFPTAAILDPELTLGLPLNVTVFSGMDAISHALESTWNRNANSVTLGLATKSLQLSIPALPRLQDDLGNIGARQAMMEASLLAGLAISHTRTALAHSISYPLTAHFNLPHGIACSFTLPALLRFNAGADDGRLLDLARALGYGSIEALAVRLQKMLQVLGVPSSFRRHIGSADAAISLAAEMLTPGRAENNMRACDLPAVKEIVAAALAEVYEPASLSGARRSQ